MGHARSSENIYTPGLLLVLNALFGYTNFTPLPYTLDLQCYIDPSKTGCFLKHTVSCVWLTAYTDATNISGCAIQVTYNKLGPKKHIDLHRSGP